MTEKTTAYFNIASMEHMTKQPLEKRYALFCHDALFNRHEVPCEAENRGGHLGDFESYDQMRQAAQGHPHTPYFRFYPITDNLKPSVDFLKDMEENTEHIIR